MSCRQTDQDEPGVASCEKIKTMGDVFSVTTFSSKDKKSVTEGLEKVGWALYESNAAANGLGMRERREVGLSLIFLRGVCLSAE